MSVVLLECKNSTKDHNPRGSVGSGEDSESYRDPPPSRCLGVGKVSTVVIRVVVRVPVVSEDRPRLRLPTPRELTW